MKTESDTLWSSRWLTWSNGLTGLRLLAAIPLYCLIVSGSFRVACLVFWLSVASDWGDGKLARARGESSPLGGLLDHATDATFVVLGLIALALADQAPWLLPILVAAAFVQYMLDSKALAGKPLRMSSLGRWNGILYFVPIGIVLTRESLSLPMPADVWVRGFGWVLVLTTLASMTDRFWGLAKSRKRT